MRVRFRQHLSSLYETLEERLPTRFPWDGPTERHYVSLLALLSIASNEISALQVIGGVVLVSLLFYSVFILARTITSSLLPKLAPKVGLRAILAGTSVAITTFAVRSQSIAGLELPKFDITIYLAIFLTSAIMLDLYFLLFNTTGVNYPVGFIVPIVGTINGRRDEMRTDLRKWKNMIESADSIWWERSSKYIFRGCIVLILVAPFIVIGMFLPIFDVLYPFSEIALLTGALFGPAFARRSQRVMSGRHLIDLLDLSGTFTDTFESENILNLKGLSLIVVIAGNLIFYVALLAFSIPVAAVLTQGFPGGFGNLPIERQILLVVVQIALLSTFLISSIWGVWFWSAEYRRLPAFLEYWKSKRDGNPIVESVKHPKDVPTRPPFGTLLPGLFLLTLPAMFLILVDTQYGVFERGIGYLILWGAGVAAALWLFNQWRHTEPQPVMNEQRVLIKNCLIQYVSIALFFGAVAVLTNSSNVVNIFKYSGFGAISSIVLIFTDNVVMWGRNRDFPGYLLIFGVVAIFSVMLSGESLLGSPSYELQVLLGLIIALFVILGGISYLFERFEQRYAQGEGNHHHRETELYDTE